MHILVLDNIFHNNLKLLGFNPNIIHEMLLFNPKINKISESKSFKKIVYLFIIWIANINYGLENKSDDPFMKSSWNLFRVYLDKEESQLMHLIHEMTNICYFL